MTLRRLGCWGIIFFIAGLTGALAAFLYFSNSDREQRSNYRLDGAGPIRPSFLRDKAGCNAPTEAEIRLDDAMLSAVIAAKNARHRFADPGPVQHSVVSYFAWHWRLYGNDRCPPTQEHIDQLAPFLDRAGWPQANTELNDLKLAERLPPSEPLAKGLANIGFLRSIPPSNSEGEDSRPYARQLLAEQGEFALQWRKQAFDELGGDSRLGTSAAYLAVATNPEAALPKVEATMAVKLRRSRARKIKAYTMGREIPALGPDDANRLIELGYALARGDAKAEPYSGPVVDMLDERIARAAPPFGLMAAEPTELCRIAFKIGGKAAEKAKSKAFCAANFKGGDGAPREF